MAKTQITLPPTPKPATTLPAYQQNVSIWTRQCQQLIDQISTALENNSPVIPIADATHTGLLKNTDWVIFNAKQDALGFTPENVANKDTTVTLGTSDVKYPSQNAVKTYVDTSAATKLDKIKGGRTVVLCSGFTPVLSGADTAEVVIPFATDGTSLTFTIARISLRVGVAGGSPSVTIEKSTGSSGFVPTTVGTVTVSSGANEASVTSSLGTITSGNKVRFNVATLATAQYWTVEVDITPP